VVGAGVVARGVAGAGVVARGVVVRGVFVALGLGLPTPIVISEVEGVVIFVSKSPVNPPVVVLSMVFELTFLTMKYDPTETVPNTSIKIAIFFIVRYFLISNPDFEGSEDIYCS
jgi:hypothetical protein